MLIEIFLHIFTDFSGVLNREDYSGLQKHHIPGKLSYNIWCWNHSPIWKPSSLYVLCHFILLILPFSLSFWLFLTTLGSSFIFSIFSLLFPQFQLQSVIHFFSSIATCLGFISLLNSIPTFPAAWQTPQSCYCNIIALGLNSLSSCKTSSPSPELGS